MSIESLSIWVAKAYLYVRVLFIIYKLNSGKFEVKNIKAVIVSTLFILYIVMLVDIGTNSVYQLFVESNLEHLGNILGIITIPLGFELTKKMLLNIIKNDKKNTFILLSNITFNTLGGFILFFLSYVVALIV